MCVVTILYKQPKKTLFSQKAPGLIPFVPGVSKMLTRNDLLRVSGITKVTGVDFVLTPLCNIQAAVHTLSNVIKLA